MVLTPLDLIQPYRLEKPPKTDKHTLIFFWEDTITNQINAILKEQNITNNFLINLVNRIFLSLI